MCKKQISITEFQSFLDSIAVVLILYKTNLYKTGAYNSLNESAKHIDVNSKLDYYVFDNSPENVYNDVDQLNIDRISYKYDNSNPGLSKPSNEAANMAKAANKKWILFTNPDTSYPVIYFKELYSIINSNTNIELFVPTLISGTAIVSPAKYRFFIGSSPKEVFSGVNNLDQKLILYSGMFTTLNVFFEVGGFNDKIKLDFMDCYFSENYKKKYSSFYLLPVQCEHDLSSSEKNTQKVLTRFKYYCEGAKYYATTRTDCFFLFFICLLRSFKLSLKFANLSFPKVVFLTFLASNNKTG